jgi:hypothetical protein
MVIVTEVAELPSERKTKKNRGWDPPSLRPGQSQAVLAKPTAHKPLMDAE